MTNSTKESAIGNVLTATRTLRRSPAIERFFKPSWGMADQAFISLANFLTLLILARELPVNAFGQFVLVNTGLQIVLSFQGPLITQPHNVLAFRHGADNYRTYTSTCLCAQAALSVTTLVVFLSIGALISMWESGTGELVLVMACAATAWQAQEFFRRVMYTEERPPGAFLNDVVSYGGQVLIIGGLLAAGVLTATTAVLSIAITSTIAAAIGFFQTRRSFDGRFEAHYLQSNWRHGRWLTGAAGSSLINRHLWYYMLALLSGPAATATFAAVAVLLRPVGILVTSIETMLPTHLARRLDANGRLHGLRAHKPALLLAPLIGVYCLFIVIGGNTVLSTVYDGRYGHETVLILLFAVYYALAYAQSILDSTLRALDRTRPLFVASLAAAGLTLTLGWALTGWLSAEGAALGVILNTLIALVLVGRSLRAELAAT
jgi:O-antigen/teichoic acid export membrane protein